MHFYGHRYASFPHPNTFFKFCTIENPNFNNSLKGTVTHWQNRLCMLQYCSFSSGQATSRKFSQTGKCFSSFICLCAHCFEVARNVQYLVLTMKLRNYLISSQDATPTEQSSSQSVPASKLSPNPSVALETPCFLGTCIGMQFWILRLRESYNNSEDQPQGWSSPRYLHSAWLISHLYASFQLLNIDNLTKAGFVQSTQSPLVQLIQRTAFNLFRPNFEWGHGHTHLFPSTGPRFSHLAGLPYVMKDWIVTKAVHVNTKFTEVRGYKRTGQPILMWKTAWA